MIQSVSDSFDAGLEALAAAEIARVLLHASKCADCPLVKRESYRRPTSTGRRPLENITSASKRAQVGPGSERQATFVYAANRATTDS